MSVLLSFQRKKLFNPTRMRAFPLVYMQWRFKMESTSFKEIQYTLSTYIESTSVSFGYLYFYDPL